MLWWALCLMPVGPPAMLLGALTDVANMSDKVKMQVARLLTVSYLGVLRRGTGLTKSAVHVRGFAGDLCGGWRGIEGMPKGDRGK